MGGLKRLRLIALLLIVPFASAPSGAADSAGVAEPAAADEHADHDPHAPPKPLRDPSERIEIYEVDYTIRRDGKIDFEKRFRLHAAGVAIQRGPVLNFLTARVGPAKLILDLDLRIDSVERNGAPEDFKLEGGTGFSSLFIGAADRLLEPGPHDYRIRGRMDADWTPGEDQLSTVFDIVDALPKLPLDSVAVSIRMPEGVRILRYAPAVTGALGSAERRGPACEAGYDGETLRLRTTAPLGIDRNFFVNLTWPSAGFTDRSPWLKVMRQHPRLPLAVFSSVLLLWALAVLVARLVHKRRQLPYAVTTR